MKRVTDADRTTLLQRYGITYLIYGPAERALGPYDPAASSLYQAVYTGPETTVYRVAADVLGDR